MSEQTFEEMWAEVTAEVEAAHPASPHLAAQREAAHHLLTGKSEPASTSTQEQQ